MFHKTCTTEERKAKHHSRHVTVSSMVGMALAILMYNCQDYISPIVRSNEICGSDSILGITSWLFPRVNAHCHEILYTSVGNHERADIAIVIDLYVGGFFIYMLSINVVYLMHAKGDLHLNAFEARLHKVTKNQSIPWIVILLGLVVLAFVFESFYFGYPLIPEEGSGYLNRSTSMFYSEIGFGAITQILIATAAAWGPEMVYLMWLLARKQMAGVR